MFFINCSDFFSVKLTLFYPHAFQNTWLIFGICFGGGYSYKYVQNKPYRAREEWIIAMHNGQISFRIHCTEKHFENLGKVTYQSCDCIFSVLLGLKCLSWRKYLLFLKRITYLSFPSIDHYSLSSTSLLLASLSFACNSLCVYIAYTTGTD